MRAFLFVHVCILGPLLFLVYINDMSSYVHHSHFLKFADDTKCFLHISTLSDYCALQEDITALFTWSRDSDLDFNLKKFVHLSFKSKLDTTYTISDTRIPHSDSHKDLGLILSEDLRWDKHYKAITARAYKVLGLIRRTFHSCHLSSTMVRPAVCINGPIAITLLYSNMADERHYYYYYYYWGYR